MEMEKFYVAPMVEVLEIAIEKGFQASGVDVIAPNPGEEVEL